MTTLFCRACGGTIVDRTTDPNVTQEYERAVLAECERLGVPWRRVGERIHVFERGAPSELVMIVDASTPIASALSAVRTAAVMAELRYVNRQRRYIGLHIEQMCPPGCPICAVVGPK